MVLPQLYISIRVYGLLRFDNNLMQCKIKARNLCEKVQCHS